MSKSFFFFCIFYGGEGICIDTILEWNRIGFGHTKNITYKKIYIYIYIWNIILREKVCSISFLFYFYFLSLCWLLGVQMSLSCLLGIVVATDDDKIAECCRGFGAHVIMTSESCRNGSQLGLNFLQILYYNCSNRSYCRINLQVLSDAMKLFRSLKRNMILLSIFREMSLLLNPRS